MAQHSETNFCDRKLCGLERQKYYDWKSKTHITKKKEKKLKLLNIRQIIHYCGEKL
jgi:hypothetical protein